MPALRAAKSCRRELHMHEISELLRVLNDEIVACRKCPRLVEHRQRVALEKRLAYRDWTYWGKPGPRFRHTTALLAIVGLATGAQGANRTLPMLHRDTP